MEKMEIREDVYPPLFIPVFKPYEIRKDKKNNEIITGTYSGDEEVYSPIARMIELINDCDSITLDRNDAIEEFCNKYGLPSKKDSSTMDEWYTEKVLENPRKNVIPASGIDIIRTRSELKELYTINTLASAPFVLPVNVFVNKLQIVKDIIEHFADEKKRNKPPLMTCINWLLKGVDIEIARVSEGYTSIYRCHDLIQAIAIWFFERAIRSSGLRRCQYRKCGRLFEPMQHNQITCPPDPNRATKNKRGPVSICKIRYDAEQRKNKILNKD
ncbi:MAG: hypothetical protein AB2L14_21165 [Candidatus Xenobiia bacterium LiM19]